jgi:hypothetical protein
MGGEYTQDLIDHGISIEFDATCSIQDLTDMHNAWLQENGQPPIDGPIRGMLNGIDDYRAIIYVSTEAMNPNNSTHNGYIFDYRMDGDASITSGKSNLNFIFLHEMGHIFERNHDWGPFSHGWMEDYGTKSGGFNIWAKDQPEWRANAFALSMLNGHREVIYFKPN